MIFVLCALAGGLFAGLDLAAALDALREDGLNIIYSTRLVRPEMRVEKEPKSTVPRDVLDELLAPHGLAVKRGAKGSWIVVRAEPKEPKEPKEPNREEPEEWTTPATWSALPRFEQEVEVTARFDRAPREPGTFTLGEGVTQEVAGSLDNPFRALDLLPGVASTSEAESRLSVRGGGPEQNLIVFDGVELYNPFRLHGVASALHPETLSGIELSSGGFGARYGDRLASVLAVSARRGTEERYLSGALDMSITDANVVLEGKLPEGVRGSWLISGRRTYYDLVVESALDGEFPSFTDLHTKWSWRPGEGRELSFTGLFGREEMRIRPEQLDAADRAVSDEDFEIEGSAATRLLALNFDTALGERMRSSTTLALHGFSDDLDLSGLARSSTIESVHGNPLSEVLFSRGVEVEDRSLRQSFLFDWREGHQAAFGADAHWMLTRWRYLAGDLRSDARPTATTLELDASALPGSALPEQFASEVDSTRLGFWIEDRVDRGGRLTFAPGLRLDYSTLNRKTSLSPRFQANYRWKPATRFLMAVGVYRQSPGYEKLFLADDFVDLSSRDERERLENERALVTSFEVEQNLGWDASLRLGAYHKSYADLTIGRLETDSELQSRIAQYDFPPELSDQVPRQRRVTVHPVSEGGGSAWGFDLSVHRSAASRLNGWVSYSFGVANEDAYGRRIPFDYDATHQASFAARFRLASSMELSFTGRAARGFPRTPAIGTRVAAVTDERGLKVPLQEETGELFYSPDYGDVSNLNSARRPAFARLDARFTYHTGGGEGAFIWYFEILNLLNRANTLWIEPSLSFDDGVPRLEETPFRSLPLVPSFGIRWRF